MAIGWKFDLNCRGFTRARCDSGWQPLSVYCRISLPPAILLPLPLSLSLFLFLFLFPSPVLNTCCRVKQLPAVSVPRQPQVADYPPPRVWINYLVTPLCSVIKTPDELIGPELLNLVALIYPSFIYIYPRWKEFNATYVKKKSFSMDRRVVIRVAIIIDINSKVGTAAMQ